MASPKVEPFQFEKSDKVHSSIQQGIEDTPIEYYDIMVIGKTGMGKSTTADKIAIANLTGANYSGQQHSDEMVEGDKMTLSDLSMWLISGADGEIDRITRRLKNLLMFRALEKPHEEVNNYYQKSDEPTSKSQLFSNETTTLRVLDVPGFFGNEGDEAPDTELLTTAERATSAGLGIMREVLRIQAAMTMNFKRILYFIPERGPLVRSHRNLQMELEQMVHFFGKSIFDCMVLITTVSPDVYEFIPPDVTPFSNDSMLKTRKKFQEVVDRVLPADEKLPQDKPPIVFISMNDSGEDIYRKILDAPVIYNGVRLAFDSHTCARCGTKAKLLGEKKEKVACYVGEDPSKSIPYDESLCHPLIISKYWKITKIVGGIAHFITRKKYIGKWPNFRNPDDEICIQCKKVPGSHGCQRVNTVYKHKLGDLLVDHKCDPNERVRVSFIADPDEHRQQEEQLQQSAETEHVAVYVEEPDN